LGSGNRERELLKEVEEGKEEWRKRKREEKRRPVFVSYSNEKKKKTDDLDVKRCLDGGGQRKWTRVCAC
jgi:hypothetical protein